MEAQAAEDRLLSAMSHTGHRIALGASNAVWTTEEHRRSRIAEVRDAHRRMGELLDQFAALPAKVLGEAA